MLGNGGTKICRALKQKAELTGDTANSLLHAVKAGGDKLTRKAIDQVRDLIFTDNPSLIETEVNQEVLRPYLDHVHTMLLLSDTFKCPVIDWDDMQKMYTIAVQNNCRDSSASGHHITKARQLFSESCAVIEPQNVQEFIKVNKNPDIVHFRNFIEQAASCEQVFDRQLYSKLLSEVSKVANNRKRRGLVFSIAGTFSGLAGTLSGFPGLESMIATASTAAGQSLGTGALEALDADNDAKWYLLLSSNRQP